ncbi:MAG: hypothetical protein AB7U76_24350 [Pirellulales bacterium]
MANDRKMVVVVVSAISVNLTDDGVPFAVAAALKVRAALPDDFQLQQFQITVAEHAPDAALPGEQIPSKERMN